MAQSRADGIPPADAQKVWRRYVEIGNDVRAGLTTDRDGLRAFGEFCARLGALYVGADPSPGILRAHAEADALLASQGR